MSFDLDPVPWLERLVAEQKESGGEAAQRVLEGRAKRRAT